MGIQIIFLAYILYSQNQYQTYMHTNSYVSSLFIVYKKMLENLQSLVHCNSEIKFLLDQVVPSNRKKSEKTARALKRKVLSRSIFSDSFVKQLSDKKLNLQSAHQLSIIKSLRKRLLELYDCLCPEEFIRKALLESYSDTIQIIIGSGQENELQKFMVLDDSTIQNFPLIISNLFSDGDKDQLQPNSDEQFSSYTKYPIIIRYFEGMMLLLTQQFAENFVCFQGFISTLDKNLMKLRIPTQIKTEYSQKNQNENNQRIPSKAIEKISHNQHKQRAPVRQYYEQLY